MSVIVCHAFGDASFDVLLPLESAAIEAISATATDMLGNTSEYAVKIAIPVQDQIRSMMAKIAALVAERTLNKGEGNTLVTKLQHAIDKLDSGKVGPAINMLDAFINQVDGLITAHRLTNERGKPLIAAALAAIHSAQSVNHGEGSQEGKQTTSNDFAARNWFFADFDKDACDAEQLACLERLSARLSRSVRPLRKH